MLLDAVAGSLIGIRLPTKGVLVVVWRASPKVDFSQLTAKKAGGARIRRGRPQLSTSPGVPSHSAFASLPWLPVLLRTPPAGPLPKPLGGLTR